MNTALNTTSSAKLTARLARIAAPLLGSVLITFTGLQLIAGYALPQQAPAGMVLASAASASAATTAGDASAAAVAAVDVAR